MDARQLVFRGSAIHASNLGHEFMDQFVGDGIFHKEVVGRNAHLTAVEEFPPCQAFGCVFHMHRGVYDGRTLSPQFQRDGRQVVCRGVHHLPADARAACEANVLERQAGRRLPILRVGGGGSQSDWIVQTLANIMGRAVSRGGTQELSALGAAMGAAVHAGWYSSYAEAAETMGSPGRTFEPELDAQTVYDSIYKEIFSIRLTDIGELLRR